MTINSDRYLRLTGISFLVLLLWIGGLSMVSIDFDFLGIVLMITVCILAFISTFFILYIIELLDPKENDEFADKFKQIREYLTLKNVAIACLFFTLNQVYWFISTHINFQTNKHLGQEFLGGKRKRSTHRKNK
jgi:hypothetical protein